MNSDEDLDNEYLVCGPNIFEYREMTPWAEMLFDIFPYGIISTSFDAVTHSKELLTGLLMWLTPKERYILGKYYGLTGLADDITGSIYYSPEHERYIINMAMRKLREPSLSNLLKGEKGLPTLYKGYLDLDFESIKSVIVKEIENYLLDPVSSSDKRYLYLNGILAHNNIQSISVIKPKAVDPIEADDNDDQTNSDSSSSAEFVLDDRGLKDIGDILNLSVRSYNCLKRANINTLDDLLELDEDALMKVRNMGRKSLDEIHDKLEEIGFATTIEVVSGAEKKIYKHWYSPAPPAKYVLNTILLCKDPKSTVLGGRFSPALVNILLVMGYLYNDDVISHADEIAEKVQTLGIDDLENELQKLSFVKYCWNLSDSERVLLINGSAVTIAKGNNCTDVSSLYNKLYNTLTKYGYIDSAEFLASQFSTIGVDVSKA